MKHRRIFLTTSVVLALSLTACGQSEPKETGKAQTTELESKLESESESETEKETKKSSKKDEDKTEETKKKTSDQTASTTKPSSESASSTSSSKPSSGSTSGTSSSKPSSGSTSGTSSSKPSSGSTSGTSSSKPSVPETAAPHVHNWVEITHVEDQGCNMPIYGDWTYMGVSCNGCGAVLDSVDSWILHDGYMIDNYRDYGHGGYTEVWDKPITGYEWVEDLVTVSDGWRCSTCGATK